MLNTPRRASTPSRGLLPHRWPSCRALLRPPHPPFVSLSRVWGEAWRRTSWNARKIGASTSAGPIRGQMRAHTVNRSDRIVGRDRELGALEEALAQARSGRGGGFVPLVGTGGRRGKQAAAAA